MCFFVIQGLVKVINQFVLLPIVTDRRRHQVVDWTSQKLYKNMGRNCHGFPQNILPSFKNHEAKGWHSKFRQKEIEPIHEWWVIFKRCLQECPTHGLPSELLLQYFYLRLNLVNRGIVDQLAMGGIILQSFEVASFLIDGMPKVNQVWYTKKDKVSSLCFWLMHEQLDKEKERWKH